MINLNPGNSAGWLHQAEADPVTQQDGVTYYLGGPVVYRLEGSLEADRNLSTRTVVVARGGLRAVSLGKVGRFLDTFDTSRDLRIEVLGGYLTACDRLHRAGGFLYTRFVQDGAPARGVSFFFSPLPLGRRQNGFTGADLRAFTLWGNNTVVPYGVPVAETAQRIGITLRVDGRARRHASA